MDSFNSGSNIPEEIICGLKDRFGMKYGKAKVGINRREHGKHRGCGERNLALESQQEKLRQSNLRKIAGDFPMNPQIHEVLGTSGIKK